MNWESYISHLQCSGHVANAAIYSLDGTMLATSMPSFELLEGELEAICELYTHPVLLYKSHVTVSGETYAIHQTDGRHGVLGRRGSPPEGCSICRTNQVIIVAIHDNTMSHRVCNEVTMTLGDFFIKRGL